MKIEEINESSLKDVPKSELYNLRLRFIQLYEKFLRDNGLKMIGGLTRNEFYKRYILLIKEMRRRKLTATTTTDLDVAVFKAAMFGGLDISKLGEIVLTENYLSIGGSFVKSPADADDIDIIIRDNEKNRDEGLELKVGRLLTEETDKAPHFVYAEKGPHSSYIPVFDLVLRAKEKTKRVEIRERKVTKEELEKALIPGHPFTPLKSRGGYGKYEFGDTGALWTTWAQGYIPDPGVAVETKFDGFRIQVHKWDDNVKMFSEDAKRDLSPALKSLTEEIDSMKGSFILDGELLIYVNDEKIDRKDMPTYLMAKKPPPFTAKVYIFDCLYRDGEALLKDAWTDRQKALDAVFKGIDEKLLERVKPTITKTKEQFMAAVKKRSGELHSEGSMCKVINSTYPTSGDTAEWAKFKNLKELRVRVVGKETKEGGGFIYICEIKGGIPIGRTYATKVEASKNDILEVAVAEVKYDKDNEIFTWDNPIVRSKKPAGTALTTREQAIALSQKKRTKGDELKKAYEEFGNITFKVGDKGTGIMQIHIMGLSEEEIDALKKAQGKILVARADPMKLEQALKQVIGNHGAHLDMRMRKGKENTWQGNEIFIGNIEGLSKLKGMIDGGKKLRAPWKQSRAEEPEAGVIRGPLGWMEAGTRKIEFFKPGESGATANQWGAMLRIDKFKWEMYLADEHAKKLRFTGGKYLDGNYLFAFVPVGEGERIWMMSRLADDDHEKEVTEKGGLMFKILKVNKKKQIVGGIIYQPGVPDTQDDYTDAEEIEKAMYKFMEKYGKDPRRIKVEHKGKAKYFPVLESFQPEQDILKGGKKVPAGSWWLMIKIHDKEIWDEIEAGNLTGFSMGGRAREGD